MAEPEQPDQSIEDVTLSLENWVMPEPVFQTTEGYTPRADAETDGETDAGTDIGDETLRMSPQEISATAAATPGATETEAKRAVVKAAYRPPAKTGSGAGTAVVAVLIFVLLAAAAAGYYFFFYYRPAAENLPLQ